MNNIPTNIPKRNEFGLLENIDYKFNDQGFIDWKAMISPEFLYVNPDQKRRKKIEEKYGKPYADIKPIEDNIDDADLIIMLGGLKQILRIKGFTNVSYWIKEANENFAAVTCTIDFLPSYESENKEVSYSENACAHNGNTMNFAKDYLLEIATNRSLARCIRNACNINIVSREEIQGSNFEEESKSISTPSPIELLTKKLNEKSLTFDYLKKNYPKFNKEWTEIKSIGNSEIFAILGWINLSNKK